MTKKSRLALTILAATLAPAPAWAAAHAATDSSGLVGFNALKLTAAQQRSVYQGIGDVPEVKAPPHYLIYVGGTVPKSIKLKPLPAAATAQTPKLKNDKYVKFDEGRVLLVNPQDRTIVEVISHYHGTVPQAG
jgi:hypothetical protein